MSDGLWPPWHRRRDGIAELARYVDVNTLINRRVLGPEQLDRPYSPDGDALAARERYRELKRLRLRYGWEPWSPTAGQQIRHAAWIDAIKTGTCLDLAVLYATMCLDAHTLPLLAIDRNHAWVVLRLGTADDRRAWHADTGGTLAPPGTMQVEAGVWRIDDAALFGTAIESRQFTPVDCVRAALDTPFETAVTHGRSLINEGAELVDVAWLLTHGVTTHSTPTHAVPPIRMYVPEGGNEFRAYRSRPHPNAVVPRQGTLVLHGVQGSGKSTLARAAVVEAKGWFLDASTPETLVDSLARAELAERAEYRAELTDQAREGYAYAAVARLRDTTDPWLVVLDNADGPPGSLRDLVPRPQPEAAQVLIITSTNPDWEFDHRVDQFRTLPPLDEDEVAADVQPELVPLIEGRPLLLEAFRTLADRGTRTGHAALATGDGPRAYWLTVRDAVDHDEGALRVAAIAAQLPPDDQPLELLARLGETATGFAALAALGLFTWREGLETARLHRLFATTIRDDLPAERLDESALRVTEDPEALGLLDRRGDIPTIRNLEQRLSALDDCAAERDERLGRALHNLAWALELKGDTPGSGGLYARAERHLQASDPEVVQMLASCLQGRTRTVNQQHADNEEMVRGAIEVAREAQRLLRSIGGDDRIGKSRAMEGLLLQKTARFVRNRDDKLGILHRALAILLEADELRGGLLQPYDSMRSPLREDDPERARSTYNLAGIRIDLAKLERDKAHEHLAAAEDVYTLVRNFRTTVFGRHAHPHVAACDNGLGIVAYSRATLLPADALTVTGWLRDATHHAYKALVDRETYDGPEDLKDTHKTTELLAKISTARNALPFAARSTIESLHSEVLRELAASDLVVDAISPLTADVDPVDHVRAWTKSAALARLVSWFGGTPPAPDAPLEEALAMLDEFSAQWDTRGGLERNQVRPRVYSGYDRLAVEAAARALGLATPDERPPHGRYDHIIVLGGHARACLSRPLAAARLLADDKVTAGDVIVLSAFRLLNDRDRTLLRRLEIDPPEHEFATVDLGTRRAFGANGAAEVDAGGTGHERWERRAYVVDGQPRIEVVAAPAPSADQRATTVTQLAWLAAGGGLLAEGDSILLVTTHHYRNYQVADAIRAVGALNVTVEGFGMLPGAYDYRLAYAPNTTEYLQEIRSTIRAYRALVEKLAA